ncbi:hypothetical protein MMC07_007847 [Pseudocyphellaria aurata]|nr:hypothetical protein [Pseudocyphellaria aurata]
MSPRAETSPTPQLRATPGAFPSGPADPESPNIISTQLSLSQAVFERRAEYTRSYQTRLKVGTWNVASLSGTQKDIGAWFVDGKGVSEDLCGFALDDEEAGLAKAGDIETVRSQEDRQTKKEPTVPWNDVALLPGGDEIGLYVLGLQEIVDISSAAEALRPYSDPHPARKWKRAVAEALPKGYQQVAEQQLIGLFMVIYASPSIAPTISSVSTTSVGTGLLGYMGNKGAVTARIVLGETTRIVFVNCHLTAGTEKGNLERRNWDSAQILSRTKFEPIYNGGGVMEEFSEGIGDEDFAFWFGDLNYRLDSMPGEDVRRLLMLHTQKQYEGDETSRRKIDFELSEQTSLSLRSGEFVDGSSEDDLSLPPATNTASDSSDPFPTLPNFDSTDPASDPASLQTTLSSLLPHDQLHLQMRTGKAFYDGWREGHIGFLPTYKYDVGSVGMFDSSEKRRAPSWCDRILYRTRKDRLEYLAKIQGEQEIKKRDEEMRTRGIDDSAAEDEAVLFDYDPETDGAQDEYDPADDDSTDSEVVTTRSGFEERLHLDYYTSHQRVLSSDHKPLDAVFTLTYEAVDSDLKTKIHQEVARELDKAENEGRPVVTVVVDPSQDIDDSPEGKIGSPGVEGVNFGAVRYDRPRRRTITVANTGRVSATVGFVDRSVEPGRSGGVAPLWLKIEFDRASDNDNANANALREYTLRPGDAANVELTIHVTDIPQVRRLNDGVENLEDVLVLRIQNGRDYFLPVRGSWLQSAFGRSLDKLIRIPEGGVRRLQHQRPSGHSHEEDAVKWSAPRELFRLTESIEDLVERSIAEWEMKAEPGSPPWQDAGWPFAMKTREGTAWEGLKQSVRESLDTDSDFTLLFPAETPSIRRLEALAETLLTFVASLEDGIITAEMWLEIEKGILERERSKKTLGADEVLEILSSTPAHRVSFTFVTKMLMRLAHEITPEKPAASERTPRTSKESSRESQSSGADSAAPRVQRHEVDAAFAALFADAMIRAPALVREKERKASEARRRAVVEVFLRADWEEHGPI